MRLLSPIVFVVFLLSLAACSSLGQGPNDTLRAYARAIQDGHVEDAYALLSVEARRTVSLEAFRRMVRDSPTDMQELARALGRPASTPKITATVATTEGDEVLLIFEHGHWRMDGDSVDLYSQATPQQAIRGFVRAFEHKRYDILMRYVPESKKGGDSDSPPLDEAKLRTSWEGPQHEELVQITQGLKAALAHNPIEATADHATMPYGAQGTLEMVREHGLWKIESFNLSGVENHVCPIVDSICCIACLSPWPSATFAVPA